MAFDLKFIIRLIQEQISSDDIKKEYSGEIIHEPKSDDLDHIRLTRREYCKKYKIKRE